MRKCHIQWKGNKRAVTKQFGSILVISVIILAILAGLSVTVLSSSVTEKNISARDQDQGLAQESANTAAAQAKQLVSNNWETFTISAPPCASPPCVMSGGYFTNISDFTQQPVSWWSQYGSTFPKQNASLAGDPQYVLISLGCDAVSGAYRIRIVTRAVGVSTDTVAFADSMFSMPFSNQNATGTARTSTVLGMVDGVIQGTYQMSPSTSSRQGGQGFFFRDLTPSSCPQIGSSYATCEKDCADKVRVIAWTKDNGCVNVYGPWSSQQSSLNMTLSGAQHTVACATALTCGGTFCTGVTSGSCATCNNIACSPPSGCSTTSTTTYCPGSPAPCSVGSMSCGGTTCAGTPSTGCQSCTGCGGSPCSCSTYSYCPGAMPAICATSSCPPPPPPPPPPSSLRGPDGTPWPVLNPSSGPTCQMKCWTGSNGSYSVRGTFTVQGSYNSQGHCVPTGHEYNDSRPGGISVAGTGLTDFCSWYFDCCSPCDNCDNCIGCTYPSSACAGCSGRGNCTSGYCWGGG